MDNAQYTDIVRAEGGRLLEAAAHDLDAAVPACPGWSVADLVAHVGRIYGWVAEVVAAPGVDRPGHPFPEAPPAPELLAWARAQLDALLAVFESAAPGTPCWNWAGDDGVDFYYRRMAHESLVHRHDVEAAVGAATPIDPALAADGIDELLAVGMQSSANPNKVYDYPAGSLHLHRTDGEGEWLVRTDAGSLVITREHAKGDVAVRGTAVDLWRYLWGRGGQDLEIFGDGELAAAWAAVAP